MLQTCQSFVNCVTRHTTMLPCLALPCLLFQISFIRCFSSVILTFQMDEFETYTTITVTNDIHGSICFSLSFVNWDTDVFFLKVGLLYQLFSHNFRTNENSENSVIANRYSVKTVKYWGSRSRNNAVRYNNIFEYGNGPVAFRTVNFPEACAVLNFVQEYSNESPNKYCQPQH